MSSVLGCGFNGFSQLKIKPQHKQGIDFITHQSINSCVREFMVLDVISCAGADTYSRPCTYATEYEQVAANRVCVFSKETIPDVNTRCGGNKVTSSSLHSSTAEQNPNSKYVPVKEIVVSWDSVLYILEDGSVIQHGNKDGKELLDQGKCRHLSMGWRYCFMVQENGQCLVVDKVLRNPMPLAVRVDDSCLTDQVDSGWSSQLSVIRTDQMNQQAFIGGGVKKSLSVCHIAAGGKHTVGFTEEGGAVDFHHDEDRDCFWLRPLLTGISVKAVSCGKEHVMILSRIGAVFTMGTGGQGQLGHGDIENQNCPHVVEALEGVSMIAIAAGGWHSMVIADTGDLYVWGWNERGQLGLPSKMVRELNAKQSTARPPNTEEQSLSPSACEQPSNTLQETGHAQLSDKQGLCEDHCCGDIASMDAASMLNIGSNKMQDESPSLGGSENNSSVMDVKKLDKKNESQDHKSRDSRRLAVEESKTMERENDSCSDSLILITADTAGTSAEADKELINLQLLPVVLDIKEVTNGKLVDAIFTSISAGSRHSAALTDSNQVYTWGWNEYGQLGQGDGYHRDIPRRIPPIPVADTKVTHVVCGWWNTVILAER